MIQSIIGVGLWESWTFVPFKSREKKPQGVFWPVLHHLGIDPQLANVATWWPPSRRFWSRVHPNGPTECESPTKRTVAACRLKVIRDKNKSFFIKRKISEFGSSLVPLGSKYRGCPKIRLFSWFHRDSAKKGQAEEQKNLSHLLS